MRDDYTHIAVILDRSGSMETMITDVIGGFNKFLEQQKALPGKATFTLVQFDDRYEVLQDFADLQKVPTLTEQVYNARGWTALYDAVGVTIRTVGDKLAAMPENKRPAKVIVAIYTDGHENHSKEYSKEQIVRMIKDQRETYSWEFTFTGLGPESWAAETAAALGIDPLLVAQMSANSKGVSQGMNLCTSAVAQYRSGGSSALRGAYAAFRKSGSSSGDV